MCENSHTGFTQIAEHPSRMPSWVRRTNTTAVRLAKEYSSGAEAQGEEEALWMKNQRISHGTGELALPLKGGGVQRKSLKISKPPIPHL